MQIVGLLICVLATLACTSFATVYDENTCASATITPFFDPRFSNNSCIVIGEYTPPDCSLAPPSFGESQPDDGCPGYPDDDDGDVLPTGQILFENLADAIENCPFRDPTLIEFTGTQYLWEGTGLYGGLFYNGTGDLVIRGVSLITQTGGDPVTVITPTNVTITVFFEPQFNATTNLTTCEPTVPTSDPLPPSTPVFNTTTNLTECDPSEYTYTKIEYIETIEFTPLVNVSTPPVVVGFKDLQVTQQNVSVTMENAIYKGCGTNASIFLTEFCPRQCVFPDPLDICAGAYFRSEDAERIKNNGTCMRTGAFFDGKRALSSNFNDTAWTKAFQEEVTVELWVRPDETKPIGRQAGLVTVHYYHDDEDDGSHGFGLVWANEEDDDGNPLVFWGVSADKQFGRRLRGPIPRGQWTHVAGTWNRGEQKLYINGELVDSKIRQEQDIDYKDEFKFGVLIGRAKCEECSPQDRDFVGSIDDVKLWSEERTQAQIQALRYTPLSNLGLYINLEGYWPLDMPHEGEANYYTRNLVAIEKGRADLDTVVIGSEVAGEPPYPILDCFCEPPNGRCTATDLYLEFPYEAILTNYGDTCLQGDNCTFVHGMLIDPNGGTYVARGFGTSGDYEGKIWLPGMRQYSGPIYSEVLRFIPGRFEEQLVEYQVYNTTTNTTETVTNGTTTTEFVPGAVASKLPPPDDLRNKYNDLPGFIPGWFLNNGWPPFKAANFVPGRFFPAEVANLTYGMPYPLDWEEGDLVFVPGEPNFFTNSSTIDMVEHLVYMTIVATVGGIAFNPDVDIDPCYIPASPDVILGTGNTTNPLTPLEDEYGCEIVTDPFLLPEYLDPSQRDVCATLAEIRSTLPAGTESLAAESVLGCGPFENTAFLPMYYSENRKDRCAILQELRQQIVGNDTFAIECIAAGGTVKEAEYLPCLKNQNLTLSGVVFEDYWGDHVVCQKACDDYVVSVVEFSQFVNTPGTAYWVSGMQSYDLHESNFCPCGGQTEQCVFLNMHHATRGIAVWYNNRYCFQQDTMPVLCDYDISTTVRCLNGELWCVDLVATQASNCPMRPITETLYQFDSDCSIYVPCTFPQETQNVTLGDGSVYSFNVSTVGLEIEVSFLTPIIAELTGGDTSLVIGCDLQNQTLSVDYPCIVIETIEVEVITVEYVYNNVTNVTEAVNVTTIEFQDVPVNSTCTDVIPFEGCGTIDLSCPCSSGFSSNFTASGIGSSGTNQTNCSYVLPGYEQFGESCVDTIVQCPYEGGILGSGEPPPVPVGDCDMATGTAVVVCDSTTCIGGLLHYEGVDHPCNLTGNCNVNVTGGYLVVPCMCDSTSAGEGFLEFTDCDRSTCIGTPCPNITVCEYGGGVFQTNPNTTVCECCYPSANVTCANPACVPVAPTMYDNSLCELLDGEYDWDGAGWGCYIAENATICTGVSYVASYTPSPPANGTIVIPCYNNYVIPGPGPCSCVPPVSVAGGSNITGNASVSNVEISSLGDPSLQLVCRVDGTIACRCDGVLGQGNITLPNNRTIYPGFVAFHIDNVPGDVELWYSGGNSAVGAHVGVRLERFGGDVWGGWDLTNRFALKWPHFRTGHSVMYEMRRQNPLISGLFHDWEDGHPTQWNQRYCSVPAGFPAQFDPCYQYRPQSIIEACAVNKDLYTPASDDFGTLRFDRIQEAIDNCPFTSIIVEKANAFYEERFVVARKNMWIGSYTEANMLGSNIRLAADNITLRGIEFNSPNTNDFPILIPAEPDVDFDKIQDRIAVGKQATKYKNLKIYNCEFNGNNVIGSGALAGVLDDDFELRWCFFHDFKGVVVDVSARNNTVVELNRFFAIQGRALRVRAVQAYRTDENQFIQCVGIRSGKDTEICSFEAYVNEDELPKLKSGLYLARILQRTLGQDGNLEDDDFIAAYTPSINPDTKYGCKLADKLFCYFRGNMQIVSSDAYDQDTIVFNLKYGGIPVENIHNNVAQHGKIGMMFDQTFNISYGHRDLLFRRNALVRVQQTRKKNDVSYDLGFRPTGIKDVIGCYFPGCAFESTVFPNIQVNPRHNLNLVEEYGFRYLNNITDCSIYSLNLNLCKVTSGIARLRREFMYLERDVYAEGVPDYPCCQKPVIYGHHKWAGSETNVYDTIEWREFFELGDFEVGHELFSTVEEFQVYQVYFENCDFNGNYYLYEEQSRIMDVAVREDIGEFSLVNNRFYNWWHYPNGTQLGFVLDAAGRGEVPVVILPNGDVFKWDRSPVQSGIHVSFRPYTIFDQNPFVIPREEPNLGRSTYQILSSQLGGTEETDSYLDAVYGRNVKPPKRVIYDDDRSYLIGEENYWRDLDGLVFRAQAPANILWNNNIVHDCGMRQHQAISAWEFELNPSSYGELIWEYNYLNQTKPYLFALGGGDMTTPFTAIRIYNAGRPRVFRIFNTTVILLENQPLDGVFAGLNEDGTTGDPFIIVPHKPLMDTGPIGSLSSAFFGPTNNPITSLNTATNEDVPGYTAELRDFTHTRFQPVITSDGFLDPTSTDPRRYGFSTSENSRQLSRNIGQLLWVTGIGQYDVRYTDRGFWEAITLAAMDADTLYKNVVPGRQNTTLYPFLSPELSPLRAIASAQNSQDSIYLLAHGTSYADLPRNGPGAQGCIADIRYCPAYQETASNYFQFCATCNDGCPPQLPNYCEVDPYGGLAVPENPFYNTWAFNSISQAVRTCVAPSRLIRIVAQPDHRPYDEPLDLRGAGNFTLYSDDGAVIHVDHHPMYINTNYLTFRNLTFVHWISNSFPTVQSGTLIQTSQPAGPIGIVFDECTFYGNDKKPPTIIDGFFEELALYNNLFTGYVKTHAAIRVNASCGIFLAEGNMFDMIDGASINVTDVDVVRITKNDFDDCGGRVEDIGAVVYVRPCLNSVIQVHIYRNWHEQSRDVLFPQTNAGIYVATYWLDGVSNRTFITQEPRYETLDNGTVIVSVYFNKTNSVDYELSKNAAKNLPIGFRLTRYQPQPSMFNPPSSLSAGPRWIYAIHPNTDLRFTWHCVTVYTEAIPDNITGIASMDAYVDANPTASVNYWCNCNDACSTGANVFDVYFYSGLILFFVGVSFLIFLCVRVPYRGWVFMNGTYFHVSSGESRSQEIQARHQAGENRLSMVNPGNLNQPGRHFNSPQFGRESRLYSDE